MTDEKCEPLDLEKTQSGVVFNADGTPSHGALANPDEFDNMNDGAIVASMMMAGFGIPEVRAHIDAAIAAWKLAVGGDEAS